MESTEGLADNLKRASSESEWLDILREQYSGMEPFVWIASIEWPIITYENLPKTLLEPVEQTLESWEQDDWENVVKDVYSHRAGRYLERLTPNEAKQLKQQATTLLAAELLKEG